MIRDECEFCGATPGEYHRWGCLHLAAIETAQKTPISFRPFPNREFPWDEQGHCVCPTDMLMRDGCQCGGK